MKFFLILFFLFLFQCSSSEKKEYSSPTAAPSYSRVTSDVINEKPISNIRTDRMIIYEVSVSMQSLKVNEKVQEIIKLTEKFQGLIIEYNSYGRMIIRIPAPKLNEFLNELKKNSEEYYQELKAQDLTDEYRDSGVKLENAKKVRERFIEILKQAKNIEEILKVEIEIGKYSELIELYEGKIKNISARTDFSKVSIQINTKYTAPKIEKEKEYKPGPLGYPFYFAWKGAILLKKGIIWLFVQEE